MKFTDLQYVIIARALRVASEQYGKDADNALHMSASVEMARNFTDQQITSRALAERIEEEEGV